MSAIAAERKTIIGAKVGKQEKERVVGRCTDLKCNATDYIKGLIEKDIVKAQKNTPALSISGQELIIRCDNCGGPIPFNLADLGLRRTS